MQGYGLLSGSFRTSLGLPAQSLSHSSPHLINCHSLQRSNKNFALFLPRVMASSTPAPTRTILGPLTTTFVPSPVCTLLGLNVFDSTIGNLFQGQGCTTDYTLVDTESCWPSATVKAPSPPPFDGWGAYSPGLYCPTGNTPACSATFGASKGFDFQQPLTAGETAAGCCPR